jgi:MarR family transcriptional regulator, organic hydroperoxide resistance regulator
MTDPRRVFDDMGRVRAQLAVAVNLRLQDECGLPLIWAELLSVIATAEPCRVHDLSAQLGLSAGGASKLVDRIEAAGYCRRRPNPGDRRSSLLELTPVGRQMAELASRAIDEELERLLAAPLSEAQIRELAATLRDLRATGL